MYLAKIKLEKTTEEGKIKKVTESYLLDTLSFTETEVRITEEMKPFISGNFSVEAISKKSYSEIIGTNENKWFECKLNFITFDEVNGLEKKTALLFLVNAESTRSANDKVVEAMKGSFADYEIEKVAETKILEFFKYETTWN